MQPTALGLLADPSRQPTFGTAAKGHNLEFMWDAYSPLDILIHDIDQGNVLRPNLVTHRLTERTTIGSGVLVDDHEAVLADIVAAFVAGPGDAGWELVLRGTDSAFEDVLLHLRLINT